LTPVSSYSKQNRRLRAVYTSRTGVSLPVEETLNIDPSAKFSVRTALLREVAVSVNSPEPIILPNIQSQMLRSIKRHTNPISSRRFARAAILSLGDDKLAVPLGVTPVVALGGKLWIIVENVAGHQCAHAPA